MIVSFAREGQEIGQHPEEAVPQLLATGELLPNDHYWHDGMAEWGIVSERWPAKKQPVAPTRLAAPVLAAPASVAAESSSKRWLIIALIAAALVGAGAYFYFTKPSAPQQPAASTVATPTPKATESPAEAATPTSTPETAKPTPTPTQERSDVGGSNTISVISWNLEWFPGRGPNASPQEKQSHMQAAKEELRKLDPDVFLGQEIASWDDFIELCSVLPELDVATVSHYLQGREVSRQQTTVASKLPVVAAWFDNWKVATPQPPRGYACAVVQVPDTDKLLLVYSVHLKSNRARSDEDTQENYAQREESARQLLAHVKLMEEEAFKGRIAGVIVGGDFNTNHDGQFEDDTIEMLTEAGFVNTWEDVPRKQRQTWMGSGRYEPTTFDYIMTKGLDEATAELIDIPEEASDHRPVALEIELSSR